MSKVVDSPFNNRNCDSIEFSVLTWLMWNKVI